MDPWSTGLTVLIALGLVATVAGALYDRARNRRRAAEVLAPPRRPIPQLPPEAPAPAYVTELQARRPPEHARTRPLTAALSDADRDTLRRRLEVGDHAMVPVGWASPDFVTDPPSGLAVLDNPAVLVCGDPIGSIREMLGLLERVGQDRRPLVVVAPELAADVLATLEVNQIQQTLALVVVRAPDPAARSQITAATGATITERADRQAGYVPPDHLGHCDRWVSSATASHVLAASRHRTT